MDPTEKQNPPPDRKDPKNRPPAMARALLVWLFLMALAISIGRPSVGVGTNQIDGIVHTQIHQSL